MGVGGFHRGLIQLTSFILSNFDQMTDKEAPDQRDLFNYYVKELCGYLNWSLSNLNKYKNELIDVGFVVYLELFVKLFKKSVKLGKEFLMEFKNVFNYKYESYIKKLSEFNFVDQLDELLLLSLGYNKNNKYIIIITRNCLRVLKNWLNVFSHDNIINIVLLEKVEFIDSEIFNHNSIGIFSRYFLIKYGINLSHINNNLNHANQQYLGLYIKDIEYVNNLNNNFMNNSTDSSNKVIYGLPCEIFSNDYGNDINKYILGINGEFSKMEDYRKLIPLPKPGSFLYDSLRSLYNLQYNNRILFNSKNNENNVFVLNYNICNVNDVNCSAISSIDGRHVALGLKDGTVLLYDLFKSQCEDAYNDISCIVGKDIAKKTISKMGYVVNEENGDSSGFRNGQTVEAHDGLVQCLTFGERGQVLLTGGIDSVIKLFVISDNKMTNPVIYNNSNCNGSSGNSFGNSGSNSNNGGGVNGVNGSKSGRVKQDNLKTLRNVKNNAVVDIDYGPFGYYFLTCDLSGSSQLWSTDRNFPIRRFQLTVSPFCKGRFHPNGSLVSLLTCDDYVKLYDLKSNYLVNSILINQGNSNNPSSYGNNYGNYSNNLNSTNSTNYKDNNSNKDNNNSNNNNSNDYKDKDKDNYSNYKGKEKELGSGMSISKNGIFLGVHVGSVLFVYDIRNFKLLETINVSDGSNNYIKSVDFAHTDSVIAVVDSNNRLSLWTFNNLNKYIFKDPNSEGDALEPEPDPKLNLLKGYEFCKSFLLNANFTPENVLLTLGISNL